MFINRTLMGRLDHYTKKQETEVEITISRQKKLTLLCHSVSSTKIDINYKNKRKKINYDKLVDLFLEKVTRLNQAEAEFEKWLKQEKEAIMSSEINKGIDIIGTENNSKINKYERECIFNEIKKEFKINEELNIDCAQSSIRQVIQGEPYFMEKLEDICMQITDKDKIVEDRKKGEMTNFILTRIVRHIYENEFKGISLSKLRLAGMIKAVGLYDEKKNVARSMLGIGCARSAVMERTGLSENALAKFTTELSHR